MQKSLKIRNSTAEFLIFTSQSGADSIEVKVVDENVWLTQKLIAELFGKSVSTINEHIKNIYSDDELSEEDTNCTGQALKIHFYAILLHN